MHRLHTAAPEQLYGDRKAMAAALRPIYTAPTVDAAETALLELADSLLGRKYPAAVGTWQHAWERFVPFLAFPPGSGERSSR